MAARSFRFGSGISTWRSKRPGRSSAGSRVSGRFVAAITTTPVVGSNPSISARSWFRVCSRSSFETTAPPRRWPMASISSMNTIAGAALRASVKRSRTREAPTPTKISTKLDPVTEKNGTPASPATARAMSVFPVPGGPTIRTPFGPTAPIFEYRPGFFRKSTTSATSRLAPSYPATSENVTPGFSASYTLARDPVIDPRPAAICRPDRRPRNRNSPRNSRNGRKLRMAPTMPPVDGPTPVTFTSCWLSSPARLLSVSATGICVSYCVPSPSVPVTPPSGSMVAVLTESFDTSRRNCVYVRVTGPPPLMRGRSNSTTVTSNPR